MKKTIIPKNLQPTITVYDNIVYTTRIGDFGRGIVNKTLTLLLPQGTDFQFIKSPLFVWVEGGAWRNSTPNYRLAELSYFVRKGYAVASIDYSVDSDNMWPACLQDVKTAIRFLRHYKDKFSLNTEKIVIGGESAGAHLSAMTALSAREERFETGEYAEESDAVDGAILWYCPGDMSIPANDYINYNDLLIRGDISEHPELLADMNPVEYVKENVCPMLFFHGDSDMLVPIQSSLNLYEKLIEYGNTADFYTIQGANHADTAFTQNNIYEIMTDFMNSILK